MEDELGRARNLNESDLTLQLRATALQVVDVRKLNQCTDTSGILAHDINQFD